MIVLSINVFCPITEKVMTIEYPQLLVSCGDDGEEIVFTIRECPECGNEHSEFLV